MNNSNKLSINVKTRTADVTLTKPTTSNDGEWHHVAAIRDTVNGKLRLYVDGVQVDSKNNPAGGVSNQPDFTVGSKDTLDDDFFTGSLDKVTLYNRALSAEEIQQASQALAAQPGLAAL